MKSIKNLSKTHSQIILSALQSVLPKNVIKNNIYLDRGLLTICNKKYILSEFSSIFVTGAGKASAEMARAFENVLTKAKYKNYSGIVVTKYKHKVPTKKIKILEASHPVPDKNGINATKKIIEKVKKLPDDALIINLISGGGSALLIQPKNEITLADKMKTTDVLLKCGADIKKINTIRKHLSMIKGGGLSQIAYPKEVATIIISDVVGDDLSTIGSGPTAPDKTTYRQCLNIVKKYRLNKKLPQKVLNIFQDGITKKLPETLKPKSPALSRTSNFILGNNTVAIVKACLAAKKLGFKTYLYKDPIIGDTTKAAYYHIDLLKKIGRKKSKKPKCIISGGETTVKIKGKGLGGRNMEFTLIAGLSLSEEFHNFSVISIGTDGTDGPTDAAGAIINKKILETAKKKKINLLAYLKNNDSYNFFKKAEGLIKTGPTGTNVMDIHIMIEDKL